MPYYDYDWSRIRWKKFEYSPLKNMITYLTYLSLGVYPLSWAAKKPSRSENFRSTYSCLLTNGQISNIFAPISLSMPHIGLISRRLSLFPCLLIKLRNSSLSIKSFLRLLYSKALRSMLSNLLLCNDIVIQKQQISEG